MVRASEKRQLAYNFMASYPLAALATVDGRKYPDVSMVYCLVQPDLTLYFVTRVEGKKFTNLLRQTHVALAFYNESSMTTVQVRGNASRVEDLYMEQDVLSDLTKLHYGTKAWPVPVVQLFERGASGELAVMKVTPYEMTYATFTGSSPTERTSFFQNVI